MPHAHAAMQRRAAPAKKTSSKPAHSSPSAAARRAAAQGPAATPPSTAAANPYWDAATQTVKKPHGALTVASLNVHSWSDAAWCNNVKRIGELAARQQVDILCVQEMTPDGLGQLQKRLRLPHSSIYQLPTTWGCAVLSRFPIKDVLPLNYVVPFQRSARTKLRSRHNRFIAVSIEVPIATTDDASASPATTTVEVVVLHLDHMYEPRRTRQMADVYANLRRLDAEREAPEDSSSSSSVSASSSSAAAASPPALSPLLEQPRARTVPRASSNDTSSVPAAAAEKLRPLVGAQRLWCGDFNALCRSDYGAAEWEEIAAVRRRSRWEEPVSEVVPTLLETGLQDCWAEAGRQGERTTCRFDTRIDYLLADPALLSNWTLLTCNHIVDDASDHNMVVGLFQWLGGDVADETSTGASVCAGAKAASADR